jgi:ribosomal protein L37E
MDSPATIEGDLLCGRCGYNLRTLKVDGKCPECGVPVARTFRGDSWREADARWRADVSIGIAAITFAVTVFVAVQVVMGQGYRIDQYLPITSNVSAGLLLMGIIMMTRAEPEALKLERPWSRRRILRWGSINVIALFATSRWWGAQDALFLPGHNTVKTISLLVVVAVFPLFWILAMVVAGFCRRAARKTLARMWMFTGWAGLASGLLCVGPTAYWFAFKRSGLSDELANLAIILPTVAVAVFLTGLLARTTFALWHREKKS